MTSTPFDPVQLRALMEDRRHTVASLARASGIGQATIYRLLKGSTPNPRTRWAILDALSWQPPTGGGQ
jgi:predicted transcriptional regulator